MPRCLLARARDQTWPKPFHWPLFYVLCISASHIFPDPRFFLVQYLGFRDARFSSSPFSLGADGSIPTRAWFLQRFRLASASLSLPLPSLVIRCVLVFHLRRFRPSDIGPPPLGSVTFGSILPFSRLYFFTAALCTSVISFSFLFLLTFTQQSNSQFSPSFHSVCSRIRSPGVSKGSLCGSERVFTSLFLVLWPLYF